MTPDRASPRRICGAAALAGLAAAAAAAVQILVDGVAAGADASDILGLAAFFLIAGFVVASFHALVLGVPGYLLLRKWPLRWWNAALAGFLIGAVPSGLVWLDPGFETYRQGRAVLIENGAYTAAGWRNYLVWFAIYGAYGVAGGLAFWLVLRGRR